MTSAGLALRALVGDLAAPVMRRRAARRRGALVLCLHGVADRFEPAWYRSSHLGLGEFESVVDELAEVFRFVSLDEALSGGREDDGRPCASLTFDDGYLDQFTTAAVALRARRIPATYFVTSASLAGGRLHWFDRVRLALADTSGRAAAVFREHGLALDSGVLARLRETPRDVLRRLLDAFAASGAERTPGDASHLRTADAAVVREWAADPLVTIGSHGAEHLDLTRQDEDVRRDEVIGSKRAIEAATGREVRHFAYPYGACDDGLVALARKAGYASSATTERAWWRGGADVHRVPRLIVGIGRSGWCFYKAATLP